MGMHPWPSSQTQRTLGASGAGLPLRLMLVWLMLGVCGAILTDVKAANAQSGDFQLDLKLGLENDTNAAREEGVVTRGDVLTRYFLKASSAHTTGPGQRLSLKFRSGGKLYQTEEAENALINQGDLRYTFMPLLALEQRWLFAYAAGSVKDRTEQGHRRDYLRANGVGGLGLSLGPVTLTVGAGVSAFAFKPSPPLSTFGPYSAFGAPVRLSDEWYLRAGFSARRRLYDSARLVGRDLDETVLDTDTRRRELSQSAVFGVGWRGPVVASLDVSWLDNTSNSTGQSFQRLGVTLTATASLPWSLFVSGRFGLQRSFYDDGRLINDASLLIDEDNRNNFTLEVERPIYGPFNVALRYALYAQALGSREADYSRHLFFSGLGIEY